VGAEAHVGSRDSRAGLLTVNLLRITAHADVTLGPRNLQLETAVGQGSVQGEQHPAFSLSFPPSGYLLRARQEVSSCGSRGAQITSPGSSAGTDHPVLVGTAPGTSCVLLNGRRAFQRELVIN